MISQVCDDKSATLLLIYQKCDLAPLLRSHRTEVSPNNNNKIIIIIIKMMIITIMIMIVVIMIMKKTRL